MTRFLPAVTHAGPVPGHARVLLFSGNRLLVGEDAGDWLPPHDLLAGITDAGDGMIYLGLWEGAPLFALGRDDIGMPPEGWFWQDLRLLLGRIDDEFFQVAGRALQLLAWQQDHRFCGRCGQPTRSDMRGERAVHCDACGFSAYPRINPCVIGIVTRGDDILLARAHRFSNGMFSALAGFMEVGESAEQTLVREVREEVGVEIANIRYFGSQPWPFPSNLMLGFLADYAGGELVLQDDEIAEAGFFRYDALPLVPPPGSIARALIDHFVAERKALHD